MNLLTPQQIAEVLQAAAGAGFVSARCTEWAEGVKGRKSQQVWVKLARESLLPALKRLVEILAQADHHDLPCAGLALQRRRQHRGERLAPGAGVLLGDPARQLEHRLVEQRLVVEHAVQRLELGRSRGRRAARDRRPCPLRGCAFCL